MPFIFTEDRVAEIGRNKRRDYLPRRMEAAGFVTGQVFTVDGGMTRKMIYAE